MRILMFKDPAAAQLLRAAGFSVFQQNMGNQRFFAAEDSSAVRNELNKAKGTFNWSSVLTIDRMMF